MKNSDSPQPRKRARSSAAGKPIAAAPSIPSTETATAPAPAPAPETQPEPEFGYAPPAHYDPAEYRWVPVKRKPRCDGWTEEKMRRFIEVLADTGLVSLAAKEVGLTRMSAYRLRRSPHGAAFARAWDLARERAGTLIEDIAFERAIEGVEQECYDGYGDLAGTKTIYSDRLLTFMLGHLKPERYSREARQARAAWLLGTGHKQGEPGADASIGAEGGDPVRPELPAPNPGHAPGEASLDDALRAMEPVLPAPAEELLGTEQLEHDLLCAEITDGKLGHFHREQIPPKSPEAIRAAEIAAQYKRGRLADEKMDRDEHVSDEEFNDHCIYLDPSQAYEKRKKRRGPDGAAS